MLVLQGLFDFSDQMLKRFFTKTGFHKNNLPFFVDDVIPGNSGSGKKGIDFSFRVHAHWKGIACLFTESFNFVIRILAGDRQENEILVFKAVDDFLLNV